MSAAIKTSHFGNFKQVSKPRISVIPVSYEYTTTFKKGTKNGPQAILNASTALSSFDDELWTNISEIGINTGAFVEEEFTNNETKRPFRRVESAVRSSVIGGTVPVVIGGEASITHGSLKAIYDLYPDISVLHLSNRPKLILSKENSFSSSCSMAKILESTPDVKLVQVGIRSLSEEEANLIEERPSLEVYFASEKSKWDLNEMLSRLNKNVYLSFDFGVFDSSVMPSTSLPEPGGLSWKDVTNILRNVCAYKDIVGMDFVEFSPIEGNPAPDLLAAKLIYKIFGYTFAAELGLLEDDNEDSTSENTDESMLLTD